MEEALQDRLRLRLMVRLFSRALQRASALLLFFALKRASEC